MGSTHRHVFRLQALVWSKVLNVGEVERTRYIWSLGYTLGITWAVWSVCACVCVREREKERIKVSQNLITTYFLIFVLALICDCALPLLRPGSSNTSKKEYIK